ncbi:long-chain fatty acid--CoA ligase [Niallia oryzisoli]|uniref:Long-chain fatty acid--CoA ligase n=1 Tax=Niallia oryzisoli TaxID=1737571 RepID=A0ABZ2CGQ6_9BACI
MGLDWEFDWITNRARLSPHTVAIVHAEQGINWTFSEVNHRAQAAASWLKKQGIVKGDRVALLSPNHVAYFDLLFACIKLGAIFVPINWRLSSHEIDYILQDCTPKLIGFHSSFVEKVAELDYVQLEPITFEIDHEGYFAKEISLEGEVEISELDPLAILYTGGTTGKPKGVVLSHQSIIWNGLNTVLSWNLSKEDTTLTYMPLFHTGGLNALSIPLLMVGGKVVIASDYDPVEAIRYLNHYHCTIVLLVPTMYHMMVNTDEFKKSLFPTVKIFLSGGAPCSLEIYKAFRSRGLTFKEGYGLTEAGPNNFYIDPDKVDEKLGSVGKPMLFNIVKIINEDGEQAGTDEVGELLIKGKHVFLNYWNNQEATDEALSSNWLQTGDLAKKDGDGYYYIVGRKKDMIITGGENVYPLEVEHWITELPQVAEAAVVGLPDQKWGEIVAAFIVLKENEQLTKEDIKHHCATKLGKYKVPKQIIFLNQLPKTHVGKIDKKALKKHGDGSTATKN